MFHIFPENFIEISSEKTTSKKPSPIRIKSKERDLSAADRNSILV